MLLELKDVWYRYPGMDECALREVDLSLSEGEALLLTGPNGAGKTTLLLVAAGLLKPLRGDVLLMGRSIWGQLPEARKNIGLLFQNPESMLFNPTVLDEIAYVPRQLAPPEKATRLAAEAAGILGLSGRLLGRPTYALSYGEKKLVALASIISYKPRILLLDEPFTNLHPRYTERIKAVLREHLKHGGGIIIASHDAKHYLGITHRIICLEEGRITGEFHSGRLSLEEQWAGCEHSLKS